MMFALHYINLVLDVPYDDGPVGDELGMDRLDFRLVGHRRLNDVRSRSGRKSLKPVHFRREFRGHFARQRSRLARLHPRVHRRELWMHFRPSGDLPFCIILTRHITACVNLHAF